MKHPHYITQDLVREAITDAIRRFVGLGKQFSADEVAAKTGIDVRTVRSYLSGESPPSIHRLLRLGMVLGPPFLNEILLIANLGGVKRLGQAEVDAPETVREMVSQTKLMLDRLADGNFDHRERAATGRELLKLAGRLNEQATAMLKKPEFKVKQGGRNA